MVAGGTGIVGQGNVGGGYPRCKNSPGGGGAGGAGYNGIGGASGAGGAGGLGGGGAGTVGSGTATPGTDGLGGGGGGNSGSGKAARGGSGIVILSQPNYAPAPTFTCSPTLQIVGSNRVYTFSTACNVTF